MINYEGFTLTEVLITVVVLSIISLVVAKNFMIFTRSQVTTQVTASLESDANMILERMNVSLSKAGDGVTNSSIAGQSIFADFTVADSSSICFFHKDAGTSQGTMDSNDVWMRYSLDSNNRIKEDTYITATSTSILPSTTPNTSITLQMNSPDEKIGRLEFNYYTSQQQRVLGGYSASWVKIHLELIKGDVTFSKETWVMLKNVIYGPQN